LKVKGFGNVSQYVTVATNGKTDICLFYYHYYV